jgi:hypothetical protein
MTRGNIPSRAPVREKRKICLWLGLPEASPVIEFGAEWSLLVGRLGLLTLVMFSIPKEK